MGLVIALVGCLVVPGAGTAAATEPATCTPHDVSFSTLVLSGHMHGTLCRPAGDPQTVLALVPGATYAGSYWDFPYQPETYSFRRAMNAAGHATFVVDRIGTGQSSRPLSALVTMDAQAAALHQVIQRLRSGQLGGHPYAKVILGGHSLGSLTSVIEAVTYHDSDAVLLTGIAHGIGPSAVPHIPTLLGPAGLDPVTAAQGYSLLDPGYLTTATPSGRTAVFHASRVDPNVAAADEATKSVFSAGELPGGLIADLTPASVLIDVPVLLTIGGADVLFCVATKCSGSESLRQAEAPFFGPAAQLQTYVLPGSGHDLNLDPYAPEHAQAVIAWVDAVTGS